MAAPSESRNGDYACPFSGKVWPHDGSALMPAAGVSEKYSDYTSWTVVSDLAKKQYHWKTFGNQNVRMIDLAQALKAAGDKKVTVEMGPQDRSTFTPSPMVEVK